MKIIVIPNMDLCLGGKMVIVIAWETGHILLGGMAYIAVFKMLVNK